MNYSEILLSLLSGFCLFQTINCDSYLSRMDCSICHELNNQVDHLRSTMDVWKFHMESMEQNIMQNSKHIQDMDRRLQMLEMRQVQQVPQPYARSPYDPNGMAGMNAYNGINALASVVTPKDYYELKYQHTILNTKVDDIDAKVKEIEKTFNLDGLRKLSEQDILSYINKPYGVSKSTEQNNIMDYLNNKGGPKVCTRNALNQKLECSDLQSPSNCADSSSLNCSDKKCLVRNHIYGPESFLVPCEDNVEGGGWTVIQRRMNGSVNFNREWSDYKKGFGDLDGEFWLGLDKIHALTTELEPVELMIEMKGYNDEMRYARYDTFLVGDENSKYLLKKIDGYSGSAGDTMTKNKWYKFSTKDKDNGSDCPIINRGAWWFSDCLWSNLNGVYYGRSVSPDVRGVFWKTFYDYVFQMKYVQMMIRPRKTSG